MTEENSPKHEYTSSSDYEIKEEIGGGSYGRALLARDKKTNQPIVVKEISFKHLSQQEQAAAKEETHILALLNHPNIIAYYGSFLENDIFHIVMEYADGGDLSQKIQGAKEPFSEDQILKWFIQISFALLHIHEKKILHRDLKAQNVFLTAQGMVKLGDFGIAKLLDHTTAFAKTSIGTPFYLSPEICEGKQYNAKSDIWSLGCVLYELCTLKKPFDSNCINGLIIKIISKNPEPIPNCYSKSLKELVKKLLRKNPVKRPSIQEILNLKYIKDKIPLLIQDTQNKIKLIKDPKSQTGKTKNTNPVRRSNIPVKIGSSVSKSTNFGSHMPSSPTSLKKSESSQHSSEKQHNASRIRPPSTPPRRSAVHTASDQNTSQARKNIKTAPLGKNDKIVSQKSMPDLKNDDDDDDNDNDDVLFEDDFIDDDDLQDYIDAAENVHKNPPKIISDDSNHEERFVFRYKDKPFEDDPSCPNDLKTTDDRCERNEIVRSFLHDKLGPDKFHKAYNLVSVESEAEKLNEQEVEDRLHAILKTPEELEYYPLIQQLSVSDKVEDDSDGDYF